MSYIPKYSIQQDLVEPHTHRRQSLMIPKVLFVVAHDVGVPNSTARNNADYFKRTARGASPDCAHMFVDDKSIIEIIPAFIRPEKARHVLYNTPIDNRLYGDDANDVAIGVELCYGSRIDPVKAYDHYVWTLAYLCYWHKLSPTVCVVGHQFLDPKQRTDPTNALKTMGKTYNGLITDVSNEYYNILRGGKEEEEIEA